MNINYALPANLLRAFLFAHAIMGKEIKSMKSLIVGNWKMNPATLKEAKRLFESVKRGVKNLPASASKTVEIAVCPPFVYLPLLKGLTLGSQDSFWKDKGAFTGEISPAMLKDLKVAYVILGHSERRKHNNETDQEINKKIKQASSANLKVILCVGETIEEQKRVVKSEVLERQITQALRNVTHQEVKNITIAYEPVWAVGTGNNCSPDEAQKSILFIKKVIANLYTREISDDMKILYGGSVNSKNSGSYIKEAGANGLLVGGASLDAKEFIKILGG